MADYNPKTNWLPDDPITEDDLNRIELGIQDANDDINNHKFQTNNPHGVTKAQVGLGSVDNVRQASKQEFDTHKNDKANPHGVTKSQVGLGNVDNFKQATKVEFDTHKNDKDNPHDVTKSQVGLGSVENYGIATQAEAEAGTSNSKYMTPWRTKQAIDKGITPLTQHLATIGTTIVNHIDNKNNPHGVTSQQINRIATGWPANTSYSDLPTGITITSVPSNSGYPLSVGTLITNNYSLHRCNQLFFSPSLTPRLFFRIYHNDSGWTNWVEVETVEGAQEKIDAIDTQKINRLIANSKTANSLPLDFPIGITVMHVSDSEANWPQQFGILMTERVDAQGRYAKQTFTTVTSPRRTYYRIANANNQWGPWEIIETTDGSQAKADQAETNAKNASLPRTGGFVDGQIIRQTDGGFHTVFQIVGIPDGGGNQQYLVLAPLNNTPKRLNGVFFGQRTNGSGNYTSDMIMVSFGQGNSGSHRASYQALRTQNGYDHGSSYDLRMVTLTYDGQQHIALLIPREFGVYQNVVFHGYRRGVNPFIVGESEVSNVADYTEFSPIEGNNGVISNILRNNRWGMEVSPNSYPVGVTAFMVSGTGWNMPGVGFVSGTVETIKTNNLRVTQHFYRIGNAFNSRQCFTRHGYDGTWSPWSENVYVIEAGENVNGSYIRYSNGMQECFFRIPEDGSLNTDGVTHYPMPASFVEIYFADGVISSSVATTRRALMGNWSVHGDDYDRWSVRVNADVSSSANLNRCYLSAYGRWR